MIAVPAGDWAPGVLRPTGHSPRPSGTGLHDGPATLSAHAGPLELVVAALAGALILAVVAAVVRLFVRRHRNRRPALSEMRFPTADRVADWVSAATPPPGWEPAVTLVAQAAAASEEIAAWTERRYRGEE